MLVVLYSYSNLIHDTKQGRVLEKIIVFSNLQCSAIWCTFPISLILHKTNCHLPGFILIHFTHLRAKALRSQFISAEFFDGGAEPLLVFYLFIYLLLHSINYFGNLRVLLHFNLAQTIVNCLRLTSPTYIFVLI